MTSRIALVLATTALSGCYFAYPDIPKVPRPQLVDGARIEIKENTTSHETSCSKSEQRRCRVGVNRKGEVDFLKTVYTTYFEAEYQGRTLTQWELRQLVDPSFDQRVAKVTRNKGTCNIALVPSVISMVGLAALTFAGPFYGKLGDAAIPVALGASGAALGGWLLSYPLGGFACMRARRQGKVLFASVSPSATKFVVDETDETYVNEIKALVDTFNQRSSSAGARTAEPAESPGSSDEPAEAPTVAEPPMAEPPKAEPPKADPPKAEPAAAEDRNFKVGDKVRVDWKGSGYDATILKVEGKGRYRIHYDGYSSSWDETVPAERILSRRK